MIEALLTADLKVVYKVGDKYFRTIKEAKKENKEVFGE